MEKKKLGRGLEDVSSIFKINSISHGETQNSKSNIKTLRVVISDIVDPENKIPSALVTHFHQNGHNIFYINGSTERYKLYGVDKYGVPFQIIIKDGNPLSVIYGNKVLHGDMKTPIDSEYHKAIEILMLNIQLTLRNLRMIIFSPDSDKSYTADFLLSVIPYAHLANLPSYISKLNTHHKNIPAGFIFTTDRDNDSVRKEFDRVMKNIPDLKRPVNYLGKIDYSSMYVDVDFSFIFDLI
ncbi:MAG: hypothetical protein GF307_14515 [candidate division Zixibacteria bacterium]|nr:hypothetical protein [candidate division Zixibacteria bacterium]